MYPKGDKLKVGSSSLNAAPDSGDLADQTWTTYHRLFKKTWRHRDLKTKNVLEKQSIAIKDYSK